MGRAAARRRRDPRLARARDARRRSSATATSTSSRPTRSSSGSRIRSSSSSATAGSTPAASPTTRVSSTCSSRRRSCSPPRASSPSTCASRATARRRSAATRSSTGSPPTSAAPTRRSCSTAAWSSATCPGFNIAVRGLCYFHVKVRTGAPRPPLRDVRRRLAQRDARAHADARRACCRATGGCPSRCAPGSWRLRADELEGWKQPARRARGDRGGRLAPCRSRGRRGVLPAHVGRAVRRRARHQGRLADPAEDGDPGRGGGERLDPARRRPGSRRHRARPSSGCSARQRPPGPRSRSRCWSTAPPGLVPAGRAGRPARARRVRGGARRPAAARPLRRRYPARLRARRAEASPTILTGLRAQRVEHPLAQRAHPRRVPAARDRDRRRALPPPRRSWLAPRSPRRSRRSWPPACSSASSATSASTRSRRRARRPTRARRSSSTSRGCSPTSCGEIGLDDVELTEHGYVFATLPGTPGAPVIGLIAHVDTTPESPGTGVSPIVHEDYGGGPIVLPGDPSQVIDPDEEPRARASGSATTSSRATARRCSAPTTRPAWRRSWRPSRTSTARAPSRGRRCASRSRSTRRWAAATDHFDVEAFGAEAAYTLDGSGLGELEIETFSARQLKIRIEGRGEHPGTGEGQARQRRQAGRRARRLAPARRALAGDDRGAGGVRPSRRAIVGSVEEAVVTFIVRDHDDALLERHTDARARPRRGDRGARAARARHDRHLGPVPEHA